MPDVFTKAKRSEVMSRIRGRGNRDTELALIRVFQEHHITGWRRHVSLSPRLEGSHSKVLCLRRTPSRFIPDQEETARFRVRPDFVFPKLKLAVFVDGCFWHGCPRHATHPKNNAAFWRKKLTANKTRDRLVTRTLRESGWRVLRIWEHDLTRKRQPGLLQRIALALAPS